MLSRLERSGLQPSDPRISEALAGLAGGDGSRQISFPQFQALARHNISLIRSAVEGNLAVPDFAALTADLTRMYDELRRPTPAARTGPRCWPARWTASSRSGRSPRPCAASASRPGRARRTTTRGPVRRRCRKRPAGWAAAQGFQARAMSMSTLTVTPACDGCPDWRASAACRHVDPELFFPGDDIGAARAQVKEERS